MAAVVISSCFLATETFSWHMEYQECMGPPVGSTALASYKSTASGPVVNTRICLHVAVAMSSV